MKLPSHVLFRKDLSLILWKPRGVLDAATVNEIVAFIEAVENRCARRAYCLRVASSSYNASTGALRHGNAMPSEATACVSWNCILVPGVICNFPAVTPCRAWRAVPGRLPGSALFVFTATLLPFTEIDVSSRLNGSGLPPVPARDDDLILPSAFVPAFNRTFPLTATS